MGMMVSGVRPQLAGPPVPSHLPCSPPRPPWPGDRAALTGPRKSGGPAHRRKVGRKGAEYEARECAVCWEPLGNSTCHWCPGGYGDFPPGRQHCATRVTARRQSNDCAHGPIVAQPALSLCATSFHLEEKVGVGKRQQRPVCMTRRPRGLLAQTVTGHMAARTPVHRAVFFALGREGVVEEAAVDSGFLHGLFHAQDTQPFSAGCSPFLDPQTPSHGNKVPISCGRDLRPLSPGVSHDHRPMEWVREGLQCGPCHTEHPSSRSLRAHWFA